MNIYSEPNNIIYKSMVLDIAFLCCELILLNRLILVRKLVLIVHQVDRLVSDCYATKPYNILVSLLNSCLHIYRRAF